MKFVKLYKALYGEKYCSLTSIDREIYTWLADRSELSKTSGEYEDKKGVFVVWKRAELAEFLRVSENTIKRAFTKLKQAGLIEIKKTKRANKIYVKSLFTSTEVKNGPAQETSKEAFTSTEGKNGPTNNPQKSKMARHDRIKNGPSNNQDLLLDQDIYSQNSKSLPPYQQIIDLFHETCPSLPKIRYLTDKRKKMIQARWKKYNDLQTFEEVFRKAEASDFLSGRSGKWTASFDWLLVEANMVKALEDNYKNRGEDEAQDSTAKTLEFYGKMG